MRPDFGLQPTLSAIDVAIRKGVAARKSGTGISARLRCVSMVS